MFKKLIRIIIVTIIAVFFLEGGIRIYWMRSNVYHKGNDGFSPYCNHPLLGVIHNQNFSAPSRVQEPPWRQFILKTNNQGLREDELTHYQKDERVLRILVLGDSQTDCNVNNSETYPNRLEQLLDRKKEKYEVLNAGVGAYSPLQEHLWLKLYGVKYSPDIVMVGFYVGNDIIDMVNRRFAPTLDEGYKILPPKDYMYPEMLRYSALYTTIYHFVISPKITQKTHILCQSLAQASWAQSNPKQEKKAYRDMNYTLELFKEKTEEAGAELVVVLIPTKLQIEEINDSIYNVAKEIKLSKSHLFYDNIVRDRALNILKEKGIQTIDLYPYFKEEFNSNKESLYHNCDWHLNVKGHELIAKILYSKLKELGWVEPEVLTTNDTN